MWFKDLSFTEELEIFTSMEVGIGQEVGFKLHIFKYIYSIFDKPCKGNHFVSKKVNAIN